MKKSNASNNSDSENYDSDSSEFSSEGSDIYFTCNASVQNIQDLSESGEAYDQEINGDSNGEILQDDLPDLLDTLPSSESSSSLNSDSDTEVDEFSH